MADVAEFGFVEDYGYVGVDDAMYVGVVSEVVCECGGDVGFEVVCDGGVVAAAVCVEVVVWFAVEVCSVVAFD